MAEDFRGHHGNYYKADVVVALQHLDLVLAALEDVGVAHDVPGQDDRNDLLDLALLRLTEGPRQAAGAVAAALTDEDRTRAEEGRTYLDRFLRGLRLLFAHQYAGWTPTIGKNRLVGNVTGNGRISHGGEQPPSLPGAAFVKPGPRPDFPGQGVRVGILDTAVAAHDYFDGALDDASDLLTAGGSLRAVAGHATFVTGLVLREAPGCQVLVRRVLTDEVGESSSWEVATAIAELGQHQLDLLNLSLVCYTEDGEAPLVLTRAIERLPEQTFVVAAAGNHGNWTPRAYPFERNEAETDEVEPDAQDPAEREDQERRKPGFPAAVPSVLAVGAADGKGGRAGFTPQDAPWIDVLTSGKDLESTFLTGRVDVSTQDPREKGYQPVEKEFDGFATWSGSSFAAALVTGAIAARTVPRQTSARKAWNGITPKPTITPRGAGGRRLPEHRPGFLDLRKLPPGPAASAEQAPVGEQLS